MREKRRFNERGQSLVELTLFVPILIFMLIGLIEIGALAGSYIDSLDASRASARYVSPQDPSTGQPMARCRPFGSNITGKWISTFTTNCEIDGREYPAKAAEVKSWGMTGDQGIYRTCQSYRDVNFFYVAGCMALLNLPEGYIQPANDYDDVIVTIVPIANGIVAAGAITWSFFGNQPTSASNSMVVIITDPGTNSFTINPSFAANIHQYATAPSTGLTVVEVYHAHPQVTKLFSVASRLAGSQALIPDPVPLHTYSVFPLPAAEPK
jgi:hypothetical protein